MKLQTSSMFALLPLAAGTHAQTLELSVKFSSDGGNTWASDVNGLSGGWMQGAIFMSGTGDIWGMGGAQLRLTATGLVAGDFAAFAAGTDTGRVGPFNFGPATNAIYATAGGFRIDSAQDVLNDNAESGLRFFQRDPSSAQPGTFSRANPALCFRFDVFTGGQTARTISVNLDQLVGGVATYYSSSSATRATALNVTLVGGAIHFLAPTPGSLTLIMMGTLALGRRRR